MPQPILLTPDERETLALLGQRLRRARLRKNVSQAEMAARAGVTRKTIIALEMGQPGVSLSMLVKAMAILGYTERVSSLMETDPIGEATEDIFGRKRAGNRGDVADF